MTLCASVRATRRRLANKLSERAGAPARSNAESQADLAAIKTPTPKDKAALAKAYQQDIALTLQDPLDPVALTDGWTEDAVRLGPDQPAEVGKEALRKYYE